MFDHHEDHPKDHEHSHDHSHSHNKGHDHKHGHSENESLSKGHDHNHSHAIDENIGLNKYMGAFGITALFVVAEAIAGFIANSMLLLTDAAHNLTDLLALALSGYALFLSKKPSHAGRTFGYHRVGILIALINATSLLIISVGILAESIDRLLNPVEVHVPTVVLMSLCAFVVNAVTAWMIKPKNSEDLNTQSAFQHLMADAVSTLGAALTGIVMLFSALNWLDPIVSIVIAIWIMKQSTKTAKDAIYILLEFTPSDIDVSNLMKSIMQIDGVMGIHDIHIWSITPSLRFLSAHILMQDVLISQSGDIQTNLSKLLAQRFAISHVTLQIECVDCEPSTMFCNLTQKQGQGRKAWGGKPPQTPHLRED